MKIKLHLGVLAILLAFLGTFIEQATVPNQQIVIQFSNANISSEDADQAIEVVRERLQRIGVTNIKIGQHQNGKLRITYHSPSDIERIQNMLSEGDDGFRFDYESETNNNSLPVNRNLENYELNISEIHGQSDVNWDFEGIQIAEINQKSDRFSNPKVNTSFGPQHTVQHNSIVKIAIKENRAVLLARDRIAYKIPEVRAGPTYNGLI